MATSNVTVSVVFSSGPPSGTQTLSAAENALSPASVEVKTLSSGANTITVPSVSGVTVTGVAIVPPTGNGNTLTLKGISGDTGIIMHPTNPTFLAILGVTSFVINASGTTAGLRLYWT